MGPEDTDGPAGRPQGGYRCETRTVQHRGCRRRRGAPGRRTRQPVAPTGTGRRTAPSTSTCRSASGGAATARSATVAVGRAARPDAVARGSSGCGPRDRAGRPGARAGPAAAHQRVRRRRHPDHARPPAELGAVLDGGPGSLRAWPTDLEVTRRVEPRRSPAPASSQALRELGVTRISFGLQSVRPRVLALLDRTHDPERALAAVAEARGRRLRPRQPRPDPRHPRRTAAGLARTRSTPRSAAAWTTSARTRCRSSREPSWRPGCVAASSPRPPATRPPSATSLWTRLLRAAGLRLVRAVQLGHAAPDARCRHNLLYWRNHHWWGIGPGAHSHVGGATVVEPRRAGPVGGCARPPAGSPRPATRCPIAGAAARSSGSCWASAWPRGWPSARSRTVDEVPRLVDDGWSADRATTGSCSPCRGRLLADLVVRRCMR